MPQQFRRLSRLALLLPCTALLATACLAYAPDGTVATPAPPGQSGESRLPQLLAQLQSSGAGIEIFSATPQNEVLAAQNAEPGKAGPPTTATASPTATVAGDKTSPTPTPTRTPTTGPSATPSSTSSPTPTVTPTQTATSTPTPTRTSTPTPTPSSTPTPTPSPPTEGTPAATETPPTEG